MNLQVYKKAFDRVKAWKNHTNSQVVKAYISQFGNNKVISGEEINDLRDAIIYLGLNITLQTTIDINFPDNADEVIEIPVTGLIKENHYSLIITNNINELKGLIINKMPYQDNEKAYIYINNNTGVAVNLSNIQLFFKQI